MDRDAEIKKIRSISEQRGKIAKEKSDRKRRERHPGRHLHVEWSKAMREIYGDDLVVPPWGEREKGIARALAKNVGLEKAINIVRHFIETWEARQRPAQRSQGELPSIHLCWGMRQKLLAELSGLAKVPMTKQEKLAQGEFSEESEALSPKMGWGNALD